MDAPVRCPQATRVASKVVQDTSGGVALLHLNTYVCPATIRGTSGEVVGDSGIIAAPIECLGRIFVLCMALVNCR